MDFERKVIENRRHIHKNPELGGKEFKTAKFIESKLNELKIPYKRVGDTGVVGIIKGKFSGKTIALRADIDALGVCEYNDIDYKSVNTGVMHACGHDAHTAIMLGAAELLNMKKNELKGNIKFIFQPNEENSNGAKVMIKAGVLKNPDVDFILGTHVSPWIKSGKIGLKYGAMMSAVDQIKIEIIGAIAHGACPHKGKDALVAASVFVNMAQSIISREIDPTEDAVITFGKIEGGDAYNVICKNVTLLGTVRSFNKEVRKLIKASVIKKIKALEIAYGVKCKVDYIPIGNALINTSKITEACIKTAKEFYGRQNVEILQKPSMGGEDFSEYLNNVPGNFIYIGTSKDKHTSYPWHHSNFNVDETALPKASKYIAYTLESFLK
ncbi:M20 family metallopeptidase [Candidatus Endomicrobiellum devescovinae]|jgi:amidohydrolase|uniref:M20 metallopeptidase family protein n=1 Tax=Candidatus Endomicrobiellum devescovinae TaxID=3242322 RepID=UPI002818849B|nr:amidohydrolase [Endomicrobium sp.]